MMRPRSAASEIDEPSEDALLEAELSRMQRSYRVMQNDYKAYREETKRIINKQKSLIEALERERSELDTQMGKMETTQNQESDAHNARRLTQLVTSEKDYLQAVKEEREAITELKNKIAYVEKQISSQRKQMGGIHNGTIKTIATHKKKAVLENRLDKAMVQFNKQLAVNGCLREDIEHLRRERAMFENLYKKLAKELENAKTEMKDIIEASTQAFEQRDEAHNKMAALRERSEKDHHQHSIEVKDLQRIIRHDDKVKEFMNIKNNDRADYISEEMAKRKNNGTDDDKGVNAEMEAIRVHEEAFNRIREVTGVDDLELIVENFIRNEEQNFALFNYVNELNSEVETLQEAVSAVRKDIDQYKKEDTESDNKRGNLMRSLERKYTDTTTETVRAEERLRESNKVLDELRVGIHTMFRRLGCDPRPIREMLGGEDGVTNKNIMIYLGQIEQRTTELLNMLQFARMKRAEIMGQAPGKAEDETPRPTADSLHIQAVPSTWDDLESDDEGDEEPRPFSEAELRDKVMRQLQRRATPQRGGADTAQRKADTPATTASKDRKKAKKVPQIKVNQ